MVYAIACHGDTPTTDLVTAARAVASKRIAESAAATNHYSVDFLAVHASGNANFVFVVRWADENQLHHNSTHPPPTVRTGWSI